MKFRLLFTGLLLIGLTGCGNKSEPEPIMIGHVTPLSGGDKSRGEYAKQGIALAVEEANAEGNRVLDRRVLVTHADTRSDPGAARSVVKRLLSIDRVQAVLGGPETAALENVATVAQSAAVPFVLSASAPAAPIADYVFFTGLTPVAQGRALGEFARDEWKTGRFAVVSDGNHDSILAAFTHPVPKDSIAGIWTYSAAEKLPALAKEVAAKKATVVLFAGKPSDFIEWARAEAIAQLPMLYASEEGSSAALQSASLPAAVYVASAFAADEDAPALKEFTSKYQERFSRPPDAVAALAYDDARMLFEAIRRAKAIDGVKVRNALAELRFDGLTGPIAFDKQHGAIRTFYVVKLSGATAKTVKRFPPDEK